MGSGEVSPATGRTGAAYTCHRNDTETQRLPVIGEQERFSKSSRNRKCRISTNQKKEADTGGRGQGRRKGSDLILVTWKKNGKTKQIHLAPNLASINMKFYSQKVWLRGALVLCRASEQFK